MQTKIKQHRMTASELKRQYELHNPNGKFFTGENMKFAGDTMSNYYVPADTCLVMNFSGETFRCYELQRKKPVKHGLIKSAYFAIDTFKQIHANEVQP